MTKLEFQIFFPIDLMIKYVFLIKLTRFNALRCLEIKGIYYANCKMIYVSVGYKLIFYKSSESKFTKIILLVFEKELN